MAGISAKLPLSLDSQDGIKLNKSYIDVVKQNFINLLLTNPGERILDPGFGVGIKQFLFEQNVGPVRESISSTIRKQAAKYLPFLSINRISFDSNANDESISYNLLIVRIEYLIEPLDHVDSLILEANFIDDETIIKIQDNDLTTVLY